LIYTFALATTTFAAFITVLALGREVRLRRPLQEIVRRLLAQWRKRNDA
jgi:hypothetical protein